MSLSERVAQAANPQEAMILIAEALDSIEAKIGDVPTNTWGQWDSPPRHAAVHEQLDKEGLKKELEQLDEKLKTEADTDERRALEARRRLVVDQIKWERPDMADGAEYRTQQDVSSDGDVTIDLPPPSPERMKKRADLAAQIKMQDEFGEEIVESFIKGGPLLLYYPNRDYVMSLPPDIRKLMVEDVAEHSPAEAHEMGRDVLKDESPGLTADDVVDRLGE